ncbi:SusC/RagA family TonB-linked outer membrane protein [Carboxylicivirga marina]|uniref:TonB-dependent receptor n=1 Tax=Carboxylicivirga marina TaxID=2800988 RepID=A0ABS1HKM5_9BACT|nr:TonB-dependent receptor [Carboxylicivirga marina]MBK3518229.1 TonB-dependent receptor [Carboxylicivirga marina]
MKKVLLGLLVLFVSALSYAQGGKTITGNVTDESGASLPGVSIAIKGTTIGTITDLNGDFTLKTQTDSDVLVFSFIGFTSQEVSSQGKSSLKVILREDMTDLDEVVVVGYGEMKKSDLTGSVASVSFKNAGETGMPSVDQLIQGRAAGVYVRNASGVPGGAIDIQVRGNGSMSGSTQPLYVVDGMILDTEGDVSGASSTVGMAASNPFAFLSPEDIENMEILKDASATAIYGARGANGVILITTKKGKKGKKGTITYSNSFSFSEVNRKLPMMDGNMYADYMNEMDSLEWVADGMVGDISYTYPDTVEIRPRDWQEEFFEPAFTQNHRISFAKADEKSNTFFSMGYLNSDGVIKSTGFTKYDMRLNNNRMITDKLKLTTNFNAARIENDMTVGTEILGGNRSMVGSIVYSQPLENVAVDEEGNFDPDEMFNSPENWINDHTDKGIENLFVSKIALNYDLHKNIKLEGRLGSDYKNKARSRYFGRGIRRGEEVGGLGEKFGTESFHWVADLLVKFNYNFDKHRFNGTIGGTADQKILDRYKLTSTFFIDDFLESDAMHGGAVQVIDYTTRQNIKYQSLLFRMNYSYKGKVNVTATGRQDYSNKLGEGMKGAFFPSFSTAYRVSEESFVKNLNVFSNLKVRAGWGQVGSSNVPAYATRSTFNFATQPDDNGNPQKILVPGQLGNPNLTWETSEQINLGLDFGFMEQRYTLTIDAYDKYSKNQLQRVTLPASAGYAYQWINLGSVQNRGIELSLNATLLQNSDWKINLGGNFSLNRNEILDMGGVTYFGEQIGNNEEIKAPVNIFREGEAVGVFYGYQTDGIIQQEDVDSGDLPTYYGEALPVGNIKFVDQLTVDTDGDGIPDAPDGNIDDQDQTIIGDPNPDFVYGITGSVDYKGFNLNFLFTGVKGRDVFNANYARSNNFHISATNKIEDAYVNAWRSDAPSNTHPRLDYQSNTFSAVYTDRWVEDASFLKLSNVTLSYTFKPSVSFIQSVKVFATGANLLTITDYSGFDPEVDAFRGNPRKVGIDMNSFPAVRSYVGGVNIIF